MAEPFSSMLDIRLDYETDISFENGDLLTTTGLEYIELEIFKLLITSPGDWKASPQIGSSLENFIGLNNTREVGKAIEQHLQANLASTIYPAQLNVRIVPTSDSTITCVIDVYVDGEISTRFPFEFDFVAGFKKITLRDAKTTSKKSSNQYQINDIAQTTRPNKYYERQRVTR